MLLLLLAGSMLNLSAQVRGISWTIAPAANYTWFNARSGLDEAFLVGGRLGLGFGEFVELRASYLQTISQEIDLGAFSIDETTLDSRNVDLARYGADLRLNLSRGNLLPYLLLGAGVQDIGREGLENSNNIFATAGLGLTLTAADRFAFTVEGKNIAYNYNSIRNLLNEAERTANNLDLEDSELERFGNWSLEAGLKFYLGGRRPGELSEVDREYLNAFGNGFTGLRLPLEVSLARINWDEALPYRDTWLGGGNIGVDIGPFIGLRAFYLRGMENDDISFNFDDLALYGGDVRLNLSRAGTGFTPFLTLGGGYIDVGSGYMAGDEAITAESQGFATGGGGLILALGDYLRLNGSARALLTTSSDITDLNSTDQLTTSWMYTAGLTFAFGDRAEPREVAQAKTQQSVDAKEREMQARLEKQREENQRQARELKRRYEQRIADLERQLNEAYAEQDPERAAELMRERDEAGEVVAEIERREEAQRRREMMRQRNQMDSVDYYYPDPERRYARRDYDEYDRRDDRDDRRRDRNDGDDEQRRSDGMVQMTPEQLTTLIEAANRSGEDDHAGGDYARDRAQDERNREGRFTSERDWEDYQDLRDQRYQELNQRLRRIEQQLRSETQRSGMPGEQQMQDRQQEQERMVPDSLDLQLEQLQQQVEQLQNQQQEQRGDQPVNEDLQRQLDQMQQQLRQLRDYRRELRRYDKSEGNRMQDWERELDRDAQLRRQMNRDITEYMARLMNEVRDIREAQEEQAERLDKIESNQNRNAPDNDDDDGLLGLDIFDGEDDSADQAQAERPRVRTMEEITINRGGEYIQTAEADTTGTLGRLISYSGMSAFAGFNLGENNTTLNFGLRWHYLLGQNERFGFMPEAFFGLGDPVNFGLSVNGLSYLWNRGFFRPYLGAGFGFMQMAEEVEGAADETDFRPVLNFVVGTYIPVLGGRLYADFMGRNLFNNNQLVAGYRFTF